MDDFIGSAMVGMLIMGVLVLVSLFASIVTSASWAYDCEKLGVTRHNGNVYECRVKK